MLAIRAFLISMAVEEKNQHFTQGWVLNETPNRCCRQRDDVSCGVFLCAFADKVSRNSRVEGVTIDPIKARKTISSVLRRGRFDKEDFTGLEQDPFTVLKRQTGSPGGRTPPVVIDICTPEGRSERQEMQGDPLLEELTSAGKRQHTLRITFPPLVKTPRPEEQTPTLQDPQEQQTEESPSRLGGDLLPQTELMEVDGVIEESPTNLTSLSDSWESLDTCLSLETPQLEEDDLEVPPSLLEGSTEPPEMEVPIPLEHSASKSSTARPSTLQPTSKINEPHDRITLPTRADSSAGYMVTVRGQNTDIREVTKYRPRVDGYQPWVPSRFIRNARRNFDSLTFRQKQNRRRRIFLSDGSYVRLRPQQLKRLNERR